MTEKAKELIRRVLADGSQPYPSEAAEAIISVIEADLAGQIAALDARVTALEGA